MPRSILALLLTLSLSNPGCLWRSYEQIMSVHLQVLSSVAAKMIAEIESGRRSTSNDVTELTYPLQRGRQFAHQYRHQSKRESFRLFVDFLDRYQRLADAIDAARGDDERWTTLRRQLQLDEAALERSANEVRAALQDEQRRSRS